MVNHLEYKSELEKIKKLYNNGKYAGKFYKNRIKDISQLSSYDEFLTIPFMHKDEIRNSSIFERTNSSLEDFYGIFSSSGTTGDKTYYVYNNNDKLVHEEFVKTFFDELEVNATDIGAVMAPVETGVMAHTMMWQFSIMKASYINCPKPTAKNIIDTIGKVPVSIIATMPIVASSVINNPEFVKKCQKSTVKKLLLGGGYLSEGRRKALEKAWDAKCYNLFGMSEVFGPMASECKMKNGLHYLDKYLMIEVIDPISKNPVKDGEAGVAVYTTLWDKGFPLLRYWTDDLIYINYEKCECGSTNPRMFYLGRFGDSFIENGKYIFPENIEDILFDHGYNSEFLLEKNDNSYLLKIESDENLPKNIIEEINKLFSKNLEIEIVEIGKLDNKATKKRFIKKN